MNFLLLSLVAVQAAANPVVRRQHSHGDSNINRGSHASTLPTISPSDLEILTKGGPALANLMGSAEASKSWIQSLKLSG